MPRVARQDQLVTGCEAMATPRPLADDEQALVQLLLAQAFPGVEALRRQAMNLLARPGCVCGCGTIDLLPQGDVPLSDASNPLPSARVLDAAGEDIGGLILFLRHGLLSSLEVYSFDQPLPLPTPDRVLLYEG